jgi:uncharacterized protein
MDKEFNPRRLDVKAFAREGAALEGREPVQSHERLMTETEGRGGPAAVTWSAQGELRNPRHVEPDIWLHAEAQAVLSLTCQRCLAPVDVPVTVARSFRFVADEAMAAAQDEESEEDVLAISPAFDLVELLEDELLMALPLAPRHVICPVPVELESADPEFDSAESERENPFAVLERLKPRKP